MVVFPTAFWIEQSAVAGPTPNPDLPPLVKPTYLYLPPEAEVPITVTNQQAIDGTIDWSASGQWQYLGLAEQHFTTDIPASAVNYWSFSVMNNRGFNAGSRPVFDAYINGIWRIDDITGPTTRIHIRLR